MNCRNIFSVKIEFWNTAKSPTISWLYQLKNTWLLLLQKLKKPERSHSVLSIISNGANICKICHSETEKDDELITPCYCSGSLLYVHQGCVQKWIKATDAKTCELCNYNYQVNSTVKPIIEVSMACFWFDPFKC